MAPEASIGCSLPAGDVPPQRPDRGSPGLDEGAIAVSKDGGAAVLGLFHDTLQVGSRT